MEAGEIGSRMYGEYKSITDLIISQFGTDRLVAELAAADFERLRTYMARRWGPTRLVNQVTRVKSVFKYAYEKELIDKPIPCLQPHSSIFSPPSRDILRRNRVKRGKRMFSADEVQLMLDALEGTDVTVCISRDTAETASVRLKRNPQLKAMILLGVNCGFGNHDCATLPLAALDLDKGWIDYARPKTGIARRCPLWTETVAALRVAIAERPQTKHDAAEGLVFVTTRGRAWLSNGIANPVSIATRKVMKAVGIHRPGLGHYTLRHVFRTVADGARDQVAANAIMGHTAESGDMAAVYREQIEDSRLRAVTEHVRNWLFAQIAK
jgi:integrase